jgi:hypothetical protein
METILRPVVVLLALLSICSGIEKVDVAYYEGRSGNIILKPKTIQDNPFLILSSTNQNQQSQALDDTLVSELVSYLVGGPIIQSSSHLERDSLASAVEGLPVSIFDKFKANLFVTIDGVGSEAKEQFSSLKLFSRGKQVPITKTSYPQDNIATLATFATGRTPSQHGIVGKSWNTPMGPFVAYRAEALPTVASVADIISQAFGGQSLILSASASYQMASAMGVHQYLHSESPFWNNMGFYWNAETKQFESIYPELTQESLVLCKSELIRNISARQFPASIQYLDTKDVLVTMDGEPVQFDFAVEEDWLLFAELEYAHSVLDQLKTDARLKELVNDNVPDLYFLSFSSIAQLKARYGNTSTKVAAAMFVLDQLLDQFIDDLSALYSNKLGNEIMFLGSKNAVDTLSWDENLKDAVYPVVEAYVKSPESFKTFFPSIYLEIEDSKAICSQLKSVLPQYVEAYCPERTQLFPYLDPVSRQSNNSNNTDNTTKDNASSFQIVLWMSIILALFLYGAVYPLFSMDVGADSLLYRMTSGKLHAS